MKRARQYIGILAAAAAYYSVHEGAHLLCAVLLGTFKEIRFMGIGMQIDVYAEKDGRWADGTFLRRRSGSYLICRNCACSTGGKNKPPKKLDPLYLSILCGFFGGGDMNGISSLCPEWIARSLFAVLFIINGWIFRKRVLPVYKESFSNKSEI